jgi:hypothetical protein
MPRSGSRRTARRARRGTIYALVLGTGLVLTLMGVTGLALVSARRARVERSGQAAAARASALAGLELATHFLDLDPDGAGWRAAAGPHTLLDRWSLAGGTCSVVLSDPLDADLRADPAGRVRAVATADVGDAHQAIAADLLPTIAPLPVLTAAGWVGGNITLSACTAFGRRVLGANGTVSAQGASHISIPVAGASVSGGTYNSGTVVTTPRDMPPADAIDRWVALATPITRASLGGGGRARKFALGPNYNPFGTPNPRGIYVVDCGGQNVQFETCRIAGTLILLDPGSNSDFSGAVAFEALPGQPSLLVRGSIQFGLVSSDLTEPVAGVNLNPVGFPDERGVADADQSDAYASQIAGLVFITGDADFFGTNTIDGVLLVGGDLSVQSTLTLRWRELAPIDGFTAVAGFTLDEPSVQRVVE